MRVAAFFTIASLIGWVLFQIPTIFFYVLLAVVGMIIAGVGILSVIFDMWGD